MADHLFLRAIRRERAMLLSARPVDLRVYETASLDKQCPGVLASVALARAAGRRPTPVERGDDVRHTR